MRRAALACACLSTPPVALIAGVARITLRRRPAWRSFSSSAVSEAAHGARLRARHRTVGCVLATERSRSDKQLRHGRRERALSTRYQEALLKILNVNVDDGYQAPRVVLFNESDVDYAAAIR